MSRSELVEAAVILLTLFALIPRAFGFYRPWYGAVLILALLLMGAMAIRRIGRLSALFRDRK
jgi:hypothetical protein